MSNFQQVNVTPQPPADPSKAAPAAPAAPTQTPVSPQEAGGNAQTQPSERPTWLPEKFKSPEDLAKAYSELEKKQAGKLEPIQPTTKVDFDAYAKEYSEKGELGEESFVALEKAGVPRGMVQQYIEGAKAIAEQQVQAVYGEVGGKEAYASMLEWAASSLDADQINAYNAAVSSQDPAQRALAVRGLYAQYSSKNPTLLQGRASGQPTYTPFQNWAQVKQAMSDPRYEKDPAYRAEVTERLRNAKL